MRYEEFIRLCEKDELAGVKEEVGTDIWYVREKLIDGEKGYTAVRVENVLNEIVLDAYNIIGDIGKGAIRDSFAVEIGFTGEGDAAECNAFSGLSKVGDYWDVNPVSCALVMSSNSIDIGDKKYTDGSFEKINEVPEPLKVLYEVGNMLEDGEKPDFYGTWYGKDSNNRLYQFKFNSDGSLVLAFKNAGSPIEVYIGFFSYDRQSGRISCAATSVLTH